MQIFTQSCLRMCVGGIEVVLGSWVLSERAASGGYQKPVTTNCIEDVSGVGSEWVHRWWALDTSFSNILSIMPQTQIKWEGWCIGEMLSPLLTHRLMLLISPAHTDDTLKRPKQSKQMPLTSKHPAFKLVFKRETQWRICILIFLMFKLF